MNDDRPIGDLLRSALSGGYAGGGGPTRDLWPAIEHRLAARTSWTRLDLALLALVAVLLVIFPDWLLLLALHL